MPSAGFLFASQCGVETEVHQDNERIEGDKVPLRPTPVTGRRLDGQKLRSPTLGCNARPLGSNLIGGRIGEVLHDLPADRRIRIEEPSELRGPGCVIE
jgi:hypothetical protein